jgi:glucosylceramidase
MSNADAGKDGTILSTVTGDSAAMAFVKGFGLQWNMISSVSGLRSHDLPIVQTEHKCGNYPWETATFNANQPPNDHAYGVESWNLIVDWISAGATSYSAWNMVLDVAGKNIDTMRPWPQNALLVVDRSAKTLRPTAAYYAFRHLSQFVDPGAQRVGTTGGSALAFKNPDGTLVAAIYNSGGAKQSIVAIGGKNVQFDMPGNGWATVNLK